MGACYQIVAGRERRTETDTEIAEKLGVSRQLVTRVIKNATDSIIYHDRVQAREYYRQREKTPGQVVNEFDEMLAIEKARAKDRQEEIGEERGGDTPSGNVSQRGGEEGRARDKAAEKVNAGVSGRTLAKGLDAL